MVPAITWILPHISTTDVWSTVGWTPHYACPQSTWLDDKGHQTTSPGVDIFSPGTFAWEFLQNLEVIIYNYYLQTIPWLPANHSFWEQVGHIYGSLGITQGRITISLFFELVTFEGWKMLSWDILSGFSPPNRSLSSSFQQDVHHPQKQD